MEKIPTFNGESSADEELTIHNFEELCVLVKQMYFYCPDEPIMNVYGNLESWNIHLVSDLAIDNLSDESRENIFLDLVRNSNEYGLYYEESDRGSNIKMIMQSLIADSVIQMLRRDEAVEDADEKRILLSEKEY